MMKRRCGQLSTVAKSGPREAIQEQATEVLGLVVCARVGAREGKIFNHPARPALPSRAPGPAALCFVCHGFGSDEPLEVRRGQLGVASPSRGEL